MSLADSSFKPSELVLLVTPDPQNSGPKAVAYTVMLRPNMERRWRQYCDTQRLDRLEALRDCFSRALADVLVAER